MENFPRQKHIISRTCNSYRTTVNPPSIKSGVGMDVEKQDENK
jgi:hypothetical protein